MSEPDRPSPLEVLLADLERRVALGRLRVAERVGPLDALVSEYRRALEAEQARALAAQHGLSLPDAPPRAARDVLARLAKAVDVLRGDGGGGEPQAVESAKAAAPEKRDTVTTSGADGPASRALADVLPKVARAAESQHLVIVGALSGRRRDLPEPLAGSTEWIDTGDGGAHAIGNLASRIKQGRVFGLVICDQAVQHKHSEPLVSAARAAGVPVGFATKGGMAGIARALEAIEGQL